jgi:hypothetical protein
VISSVILVAASGGVSRSKRTSVSYRVIVFWELLAPTGWIAGDVGESSAASSFRKAITSLSVG